ncbi:hypothetical protein N665_0776s0009 [Sinapis alba]|nr:hypothetical protein N665_0776s0009 [Sinapis alba]
MCCLRGKIKLPALKEPPAYLHGLLTNDDGISKHFRDNIRAINMMFSFTSLGGKIDNSVNNGKGPRVFKLHGENYHLIGSVKPKKNEAAKFSQLYIHDTENEVQNRISALSGKNERSQIREDLVEGIMEMLRLSNVHVKTFRNAMERFNDEAESEELSLVLIHTRLKDGRVYNLPTSSEVAALLVGDFQENMDKRDIILEKNSGKLKRINELHPCYLPLQYPLIFPYGEDGFRLGIKNGFTGINKKKKPNISIREFFAYRIQIRRDGSQVLLLSRRLFQQFLVDAYTMIEAHCLRYIRKNQSNLRTLKLSKFVTAAKDGNSTVGIEGKRVFLPSSFTGGPRYMHEMYLDAMSICKYFGFPDLFITFTCNPKWPELSRYFEKHNLRAEDRPELCCRLFKIKLDRLMEDLTKKELLAIYTVEFQKRGLPHAHILLFMDAKHKLPTAEDIDGIISAEIPDRSKQPRLYEVVKDMMIHGPCGRVNRNSPCMEDGKCSKFFPRKHVEKTTVDAQGYPVYRRREEGNFVEKKGIQCDNRFVVPYNKKLLLAYNAHINVEWCNQSRSIKYLFKYINKGQDRVTGTINQKINKETSGADCTQHGNLQNSTSIPRGVDINEADAAEQEVDEIKNYFEARYISACESSWRLFAFPTQYRSTPVEKLTFHLEGEQPVIYKDGDTVESVLARAHSCKTMFLAWFDCCEMYPEAREMTYPEIPNKFVYDGKLKVWNRRKKGFAIGRLAHVSPSSGPLYFLRVLINKVKGPRSYAEIKTVNGIVLPSYEDACYKLDVLSEDVLFNERKRRRNPGLVMTDEEVLNATLLLIENILRSKNSSLERWDVMPKPVYNEQSAPENQLLQDELNYPREELQVKHDEWFGQLTDEQRSVYDQIINAVSCNIGGIFFVYGFGGTGKTFLWNILSAAIRARGDIVLNVASSGIASLLLPGGRTAHSRFDIPLNPDEFSTCNIDPGSEKAELLARASLIIWDEAPMMSKHCFEALDRSLSDIMKTTDDKPFGGKVMVFGGDFRQILPVIPRGNRADIVMAAMNSSYLWKHFKVLELTKNMRLFAETNVHEAEEIKRFSDWILALGDGRINEPNDGECIIDIPKDLLISECGDPIESIVNEVYGDAFKDSRDPTFFQERAILAPTNDNVDIINNYMLDRLSGEERVYLSSDSVDPTDVKSKDDSIFSPEFLNSIKSSGLPNHTLRLKIGTPVMILRNIDPNEGLCNGTRLQITQLANHILEAKVITGTRVGEKVFLHRVLLTPTDSKLPFKMRRRQFPLKVAFAMTINKSQGQSLERVGLFLPKPVFSHGQLYVVVSRVKSRKGLKILITDKHGKPEDSTMNVVYKEVFQNLLENDHTQH